MCQGGFISGVPTQRGPEVALPSAKADHSHHPHPYYKKAGKSSLGQQGSAGLGYLALWSWQSPCMMLTEGRKQTLHGLPSMSQPVLKSRRPCCLLLP